MSDPYQPLANALADEDFHCQFQKRGQLVVSRQVGPIWPNRGNSFWVTHAGGHWYLFTWSPIGYRVPESVDIAALCRLCMRHGDSAMPRVPSHISQKFGLAELSEVEMEAVYRDMENSG